MTHEFDFGKKHPIIELTDLFCAEAQDGSLNRLIYF